MCQYLHQNHLHLTLLPMDSFVSCLYNILQHLYHSLLIHHLYLYILQDKKLYNIYLYLFFLIALLVIFFQAHHYLQLNKLYLILQENLLNNPFLNLKHHWELKHNSYNQLHKMLVCPFHLLQ